MTTKPQAAARTVAAYRAHLTRAKRNQAQAARRVRKIRKRLEDFQRKNATVLKLRQPPRSGSIRALVVRLSKKKKNAREIGAAVAQTFPESAFAREVRNHDFHAVGGHCLDFALDATEMKIESGELDRLVADIGERQFERHGLLGLAFLGNYRLGLVGAEAQF